MKQRILKAIAVLLCTLALFATGIAPSMAYAPPSGEGEGIQLFDEVEWYYRNNNGVEEMRCWSITRGLWITDWVPVPDGWIP